MFWALAQIGEDIARWRREGYEEGFKQGYEEGFKQGLEQGRKLAREEAREKWREEGRREYLRELVERNIALPPEILDEIRSWLL